MVGMQNAENLHIRGLEIHAKSVSVTRMLQLAANAAISCGLPSMEAAVWATYSANHLLASSIS